jgi:hypothetical protein
MRAAAASERSFAIQGLHRLEETATDAPESRRYVKRPQPDAL